MTILNEYKYVSLIGSGYFSVVKKYQHLKSGQFYAIKELKKEFITNADYIHRFRREIELLKLLSGQENIIELVAFQTDESTNLYIMPLATTNLYNYIKSYNALISLEERIALFDQVLNAIQISHSKGILHRDIYPNNVLLFASDNGHIVKMSDFGLGKDLASVSAFTRSEMAQYGSVYYAAPEQREKLKNASVRSDLYSLGKLLNFIMTGKDPDTLYQCDFTTAIMRATAPNPESRFKDIFEFKKTYEQIKELLRSDVDAEGARSFITSIGGIPAYDWHAFHRFAVKGEYQAHVYDDYIKPVVSVLSDRGNLESYYATVESAIEESLAVFADRLHICYQTTKWPFSATKSFGELLRSIYHLGPNPRIKARCLKELWSLAYEQDQWSVQGIMDTLLDGSAIPNEIQTEFAMTILESTATIQLDRFARLKMPAIIRQAISQKAQPSKTQPPENTKNDF